MIIRVIKHIKIVTHSNNLSMPIVHINTVDVFHL